MLLNLKSIFVLKKLFGFLKNTLCLKIISYNKSLQSKLSKDIEDFKINSRIYIIFEDKGKAKEYDKNDNLIFKGEYQNKKRNGFGKEYYKGKLTFEGQYKDGLKNGPGKKYDNKDSKLIFEGIYLNGEEWEGEGQIEVVENEYFKRAIYYGKIIEGKINGFGQKVDLISNIDYEGNFIKGKKWGHSKEFVNSILVYEGEFNDDKRNGYGIEYNTNGNVIFEGTFLDGQRWEGFVKEKENGKESFEGEYKNGKRNGKGKEFYYEIFKENIIKFDGNYLNGERSGKGIEYFKNGKIKFVGDFLKGGYNNGKGYNINREEIFEIKNGQGNIKITNSLNELEFEGEYKNYRFWNGKEFKYISFGILVFEFFYKEGVIVRIKEYDYLEGNLKFDAEYIKGILKKGKEYKNNELIFEGLYYSEKKFENKNQFISEYPSFFCSRKRMNGKGKEYDSSSDIIYEGKKPD